jgi:diguanylate cyclase (GGDEF)-like protein
MLTHVLLHVRARIVLALAVLSFGVIVGTPPLAKADSLADAETLVLDERERDYSLVEHGRFVPDASARWSVENLDGLSEAALEGSTDTSPTTVRNTKRFWLVTAVQNQTAETRWMVSLLMPDLHGVALVVEDADGVRTTTESGERTGARHLFPVIGSPQPVELDAGVTKTLYLLVEAHDEPGVDPAELVLRSQVRWSKRAFQLTGFVMLCLGVMLSLSLFFVIIWVRFREPHYLWFGLFAATTALLWTTAYDILQLFGGAFWDNALLNFGANASSLVFCALFGRAFLRTSWLSRRLDQAFIGFAAAAASLLGAMFVLPAALTYTLNALAALVLWVLLVGASIYAVMRGNRDARLFLAAWGVFFISALLTIIEGLGVSLPTVEVRLWTIGTTALAMLMMGLAVGHQLRRLNQEKRSAEQDARTDKLTMLRNRAGFEADFRAYTAAFNAGDFEEVVVAFMDLDGLKGINDARGHETGDNLLRTFANLLKREFRDADRAYRLGGDEFVLLLPATSVPQKGEHRWLKMRLEGVVVELRASGYTEAGVSIGLASLSETGGNGRETLSRADARMYKDKRRKRAS